MIRAIQQAFFRLVSVFRRGTLDRDFDDEMAAHLDLLTARNEGRGLPRDEARRQAILQMGGLNATRHLHREARGLPYLERILDELRGFGRDLIHAARSLAKTPTFTFVCVTSLGIGMATVIAIPYFARFMTVAPRGVNTEGLVEILMTPQGPLKIEVGDWARETWSYPDFADLRDAETGMAITGWALGRSRTTVQTSGRAQAVAVPTMFVSANYFRTVGVALIRGPGFEASVDDALAAPPVAILGYDFWQNRLGADPDIVGKTVTLDGIQHVVVGVAPDQYQTHLRDDAGTQLFVPLERHPRLRADARLRFDRDVPWVRIHGRLAAGVNIAQANAAVSATMSRLAEQHPSSNQHKTASVEAYFSEGARERWEYLILESVLLGLTGLILLVVCLNISGMMQVRVAMRERELSIRQAIGATRARLAAYLLSEAVMLAILGGALGALVLFGAPPAIAWWNEQPLPVVFQEAARPNLPIAALSIALCLTTSLMFGLLPAIRFSRPAMISALKDDAGGGSRRVGRIHRLTAALQVGIALPFLVIGGVLVDQVRVTATADLGFQPSGLAALSLDLGGKQTEDVAFFLRAVRSNLQQASAVQSVTIADGLPLDFNSRVVRVSRPGNSSVVEAHTTRIDDDYLETMEIPLLRGRGITADDDMGAQPVAVISKSLADRLFGDADAVGDRLTLAPGYSSNAAPNRDEVPLAEGDTKPVFTIVGVTADFVTSQMSAPREQMLVPLAQHPASPVFLVARSKTGVPPATSMFQNAVGNVDPNFLPTNPTRVAGGVQLVTGDELRQRGMRGYLGEAIVAGGGGGVVLTLAALGIYGVVGFMVASRTREIAVRMALGASRRSVLRMVLSDVVRLVIPGVAGGLVLGILLTPMVASWTLLPSAVIYTVAGGIAVSVALMAGVPPARRAAAVEPMVAMRSE